MEEEITMKKCIRCGEEKPATSEYFGRHSQRTDGFHNACRDCFKKRSEEIRETYKVCTCCNKKLLNTEEFFHIDLDKKDGLTNQCKECRNKNEKERRKIIKSKNENNPISYSVYSHINKINGKIYIGQTKQSLNQRWGNGGGYNTPLFKSDIKKYGWKNFDHEVIASGLTKEEAENFEILLIAKLDTTNPDKGYNIQIGGSNGSKDVPSCYLGSSKKVSCDGIIFDSASDCSRYYNVEHGTMMSWLGGRRGMREDFLKLNLHYVDEEFKIKPQRKNKKVICNNIIFENAVKCSEFFNINVITMRAWLSGQNGTPEKFKDLGLRYYIEEEQETIAS